MADKELEEARISRGNLRNNANKKFVLLEALLRKLESTEEGRVNISDLAVLKGALQRTEESLEKYVAAIIRCMVLEDKEEWEDPENEHVVENEELEDKLNVIHFKVVVLVARVKERKGLEMAECLDMSELSDEEIPPELLEELEREIARNAEANRLAEERELEAKAARER